MKVLIFASCNSGHLSPFVTEQMNALRRARIEVDAFGIVGKGFWGYLRNYSFLIKKIRQFKPEIIHAHYGLSGLLCVLQNIVPVIITFHNGETLSLIPNLLSSIGAMKAKYVVYVAEHIRKKCFYRARRFSIIPCGVDLVKNYLIPFEDARKQLGFEKGKKYILFGGAFDNLRKNYPLLKEAVSILPNSTNIECLEMNNLSRAECVLRMCACDLFALPTLSEGSPQALKEAMACNCPIVATDVADIKHLLGNLEGHYICSFDPQDVADKIIDAFDYGKRTNGRQRIIELGLSNDVVAKRLVEVYEEVARR